MIGTFGRRILLERSRDYVRRYQLPLIGVAGSWGLPVTKQALAAVLTDRAVRVGKDNATKSLDVPLSILGSRSGAHGWMYVLGVSRVAETVEEEPQTVIIEVPSRRPGDVDEVAHVLPFSVAVVTNVHADRLEFFTSQDLRAHELLSLPASLGRSGVAVLNLDDSLLANATDNIQARVVGYGRTAAADVQIRRMNTVSGGGMAVELAIGRIILEGRLTHIHTSLQTYAGIAALAALYAITENVSAVAEGLAVLNTWNPPTGWGSRSVRTGAVICDDTADATPESILAGLHWLLHTSGRRIAVLGDISELGGESVSWHERFGREASESANILIAVGDQMRHAQTVVLKSNRPIDTHHFSSSKDAGKWIRNYIRKGDALYIGGSREANMKRVVDRLIVE